MVNNTKKGEINHMKAWEMAQEIFHNAQPVIRSEEEQTWTDNVQVSMTITYLLTGAAMYLDQEHRKRLWWQQFRH